jgi:hypothetical protein
MLGTKTHNRLHLLSIARQHDRAGYHPKIREAVALIGLQLALGGDKAVSSDSSRQLGDMGGGKHSTDTILHAIGKCAPSRLHK